MRVHILKLGLRFEADLLLEQRVHDDARRARVFQTAHAVHAVDQRRGAGQQGVCKLEPEVFGGQIHGARC